MEILFIIAIVALLIWYFADGTPIDRSVPDDPSSGLGRLDGVPRFARNQEVHRAEAETLIHESEKRSVQAIHNQRMIDLADRKGKPYEVWTHELIADHAHKLAVGLLREQSNIRVEEHERMLELETEKEERHIQIALQAARHAQLAPYYNLKQIQQFYEEMVQRRDYLTAVQNKLQWHWDMLKLLNRAIPILEADHYGRVREIALQTDSGEIVRRLGTGSDS